MVRKEVCNTANHTKSLIIFRLLDFSGVIVG